MPRLGVTCLLLGLGAFASPGAYAQLGRRGGTVSCGTLGTTCCHSDADDPCGSGLVCATGGILRNICVTPSRPLPPVTVGATAVDEQGPPASGGGDGVTREEVTVVVEDAPEVPEPEPMPEPEEPVRAPRRPRASPPAEPEPMPEPEPEEEPEEEIEEEREVDRDVQFASVTAGERPPEDAEEPMPEPMPELEPEPKPEPEPVSEPEAQEEAEAQEEPEEDDEGEEEEPEREVDRDVQVASVTAGERPPPMSRAQFEETEVETTVEETRIADGTRNVAAVRVTAAST